MTDTIQQNFSQNSVLTIVKNHYFLGVIIDHPDTIRRLRTLQRVLSQPKFNLPENKIDFESMSSSFIYLGYLTEVVANKFIEYLNPLLLAVSHKFSTLDCKYTQIGTNFQNDQSTIDIYFKCDILERVIIPYLLDYGIKPVLDTHCNRETSIPLVYLFGTDIDKSAMIEDLKQVYLPKVDTFTINAIQIYKGEPIVFDGKVIGDKNNLAVNLITSYPLQNDQNNAV